MNIFFIVRGYPSNRDPQWGCFEMDQARAMARAGHNVTMLAVDTRFRFYRRKLGVSCRTIDGMPCYESFLIPYKVAGLLGGRFRRFVMERQMQNLFERAVSENGKPDILYSHYMIVSEIAQSLKKRYGIPLVAIEHWSELGKENIRPSVISRGKKLYPSVDRLLTVSSSMREKVLQQIGFDSAVVNNMYGDEFVHDSFRVNNGEPIKFVTVGSLLPVKDHKTLLRACQELNRFTKNWQLNIVGSGPLHNELQKLIESLGLKGQVHLLGRMIKKQIVETLADSDVFVLSSTSETFGVVVIEALAMGLPVICTRCGGPIDIVNDRNGMLCNVGDSHDMMEKMKLMITNYNNYDKEHIASDCQERFSSQSIARKLEVIFNEVIDNNKKNK